MSSRQPQAHPDEWPDAEVVARVRGGDRDAYRVLVRRYQDGLYRYALRMTGHPDAAADLAQVALIKGFTQIRRCRTPERFGSWLFRILVNGCKDHLKSRRRRDSSLERDTVALPRAPANPAADLERSQLRAMLEDALATLPDAQREAFVLKHVEGRSYEEIAEMLNTSVPALKMRVHRAREAVRAILQEVL